MAISTATVKAYCDTGFNTVNIPDSPATLQSAAGSVVTLDTINCLPLSGMTTSITVKSFANLPKADYVSIAFAQDSTTYYGAITGYTYISLDTVQLDIVLDGWLTCQGKGIQSISGVTKRVHVAKSADDFAAFTEPDPLLACAEPLKLETKECFGLSDQGSDILIIAATIDLYLLGDDRYDEAMVYTEPTGTGENSVTVPQVPGVETEYHKAASGTQQALDYDTTGVHQYAGVAKTDGTTTTYKAIRCPAVNYFDGSDEHVIKGIARARALGVDNGILAQYIVPSNFMDRLGTKLKGRYAWSASGNTTFGICGAAHHLALFSDTPFLFSYDSNVQNKRLLCGDMNKYGIVAMGTGSSYECNPEDLYAAGRMGPAVTMVADPRESGQPYFKFTEVNGSGLFFRSLITGAHWQNAPLTQWGASGYQKEATKMQNEYNLRREQLTAENWKGIVSSVTGAFGGGVNQGSNYVESTAYGVDNTGAQPHTGALYKNAMGTNTYGGTFGMQLISAGSKIVGNTANNMISAHMMTKQRLVELETFALDAFTRAPEVSFPMIQGLIDFVGNGVIAYRLHPSANDLSRLDKVLNAFGYAHTKMLELSDFSNRSRYNYVMATGVKINCNGVAKFVREAAEDQIAMGVRVWHRKPDNDYATANN